MNKVASFAAGLALLALGVYFFAGSIQTTNISKEVTPAGLTSTEGPSCCSESGSEMVSTGGTTGSCCASKSGGCCGEKAEMVKTEAGSCCSEKAEMVKTEAGSCCSEGKSEVVATGAEAKACPCQAGKTETVTTGTEKEECHGNCEGESGCCQEKKAEGEVAKTEGGEGK